MRRAAIPASATARNSLKMEIEKTVAENKAMLKMLELKFDALIELLAKEGILTKEEIEDEIKNLTNELAGLKEN